MSLSDEEKKKVDAVEEAVNVRKPVEKPQPLKQDRNIEREKPVRGLSGLIAPLPGAGLCKRLKKLLKK